MNIIRDFLGTTWGLCRIRCGRRRKENGTNVKAEDTKVGLGLLGLEGFALEGVEVCSKLGRMFGLWALALTRNPKSQTPRPNPQTLNLESQVLNPKP